MSVLTLQQLRVLAAVLEHRSFTRGAQAMYMSQSAASQHVRALERALGMSLVERGTGEIVPTRAGEGLLRYATEILRLSDDAERYVASCREGRGGRLILGASGSAVYLLPPLLAAFQIARPELDLDLRLLLRSEIPGALDTGTLDVAIASGPASGANVETRVLCPDRIVPVVSPVSVLLSAAAVAPLPLERIASGPLIAPVAPPSVSGSIGSRHVGLSRCWQAVEQWALSQGVPLHPTLRLEGVDAVKKAVEAGLGLAFLPAWTVEREIALGTLRMVPLDAPPLYREYVLAYHADREIDETLRAFLDLAPAILRSKLPQVVADVLPIEALQPSPSRA